jgi:hypothetical protein
MNIVDFVEEEVMVHGTSDTLTYQQNHLDSLDNVTDNKFNPIGDGKGVDVYVLDTGIQYSHPEFGGRAKFGGRDFVSRTGDGSDPNGHGTYVSSLVAGKTYGVAKAATIYSIRVLRGDSRIATAGSVTAALNYVGELIQKKPNTSAVIVTAFTGGRSKSINDAINNLGSLGVVVTAAGNDGGDACFHSPASANRAITVGATNDHKTVWYLALSFKGYLLHRHGSGVGRCVDIFARGERLFGAVLGFQTGTSGSAALVAGVAAVTLQLNPKLTPQEVRNILIQSSIKNQVDFSLVEKKYRQVTPNRFLVIPDISLIGPVTQPPVVVEAQGDTNATSPPAPPDIEVKQAATRWPTPFARVDNKTASVYIDNLSPGDFELLFVAMDKKNYSLHYLSYSGLAAPEETKFIAIFKKTPNSGSMYKGYFGLNASKVEKLLERDVVITRVKFIAGCNSNGSTNYIIIESPYIQKFISFIGLEPNDDKKFKKIMNHANYRPAAHTMDAQTTKVHTYYFSSARMRGRLYAFGNIQFSSLVSIVQYLRIPILHLTSYQKRNGESRFLAIFDSGDTNWQNYLFLYREDVSRQIELQRKQGYYPVIITPWVTPTHSTQYITLLLRESAF